MVLFALAACGPGGGVVDAGDIGLIEAAFKYSARVRLAFADGRTELGGVAYALPPIAPVAAPTSQEVLVTTTRPIPCALTRRASYELRNDDGTFVVPLDVPEGPCGVSAGVELSFELTQEMLLPNAGAYLTLRVYLPLIRPAGFPDGLSFRFFVSDLFVASRSSRSAPDLRVVLPVGPDAPGWNAALGASDEAAYTADDPAGIIAGSLRAHEEVRWIGTRTFALFGRDLPENAPISTLGVLTSPSDEGDGIIFEGSPATPDFAPFGSSPAPLLRTWSSRGFIPGERYDIRFLGSTPTIDEDGFVAMPTQDDLGRRVRPWSFGPIGAAADGLGARFAFDVDPVRIESPAHRGLAGPSNVRREGDRTELLVRVIVPVGAVPPTTYTLTASRGGTRREVGGIWPLVALDSNVVEPTRSTVVSQAGLDIDVDEFTLAVPLPPGVSSLDGLVDVSFEFKPTSADPPVDDAIQTNIDLTAPAIAPRCEDGSTAPCTYIVDGDDRDCRVEEICLPDSEATQVVVTICGEERTVSLNEGEGPPGAGADAWRCSGPVDIGRRRERADSSDVGIEIADAAGNVTSVSVTPPCMVGDRFVPLPYEETSPLHARTPFGIPIIVGSSGNSLVSLTHDGLAWRPREVLRTPGRVYRGRIAGALAEDGSTWFCATNREIDGGRDEPAYDIIEGDGRLIVGRIAPDGSVTASSLTSNVRPVGCGITYDDTTSRLFIVTTAFVFAPQPGSGPQLWRCSPSGSSVSCDPPRTFGAFSGAWPIGFEPDVAVRGGRVHIVGRGVNRPSGPGLSEFEIYEVEAPATGNALATFRTVQAETWQVTNYPATQPQVPPRLSITAGLAPRVAVLSGRAIIFFQRGRLVGSRDFRYPATYARSFSSHELMADIAGRAEVVDSLGFMPQPYAALFPRTATLSGALVTGYAARYALPAAGASAEIAPGYDVRAAGTLELAYERRDAGQGSAVTFTGDTFASTDRSSLWYRRYGINGRRLFEQEQSRTRVDVETGHQVQSARRVSLFVDPTRVFNAVMEPSIVYDNVRFGAAGTSVLRFADSRAGHFVEDRADLTRTPTANRQPVVPTVAPPFSVQSCWERTSWLTDVSGEEANLLPQYSLGNWSSPRLPQTMSSYSEDDRHRQATGVAECALRTQVEDEEVRRRTVDGECATADCRWNGTRELAFATEVRERFVGNYLSLANSLQGPGVATLESLRFFEDAELPEGSITIDVDLTRFTSSVEGATSWENLISQLNENLTPTSSPLRPVFSRREVPSPREGRRALRLSVSTTTVVRPGRPSTPRGGSVVIRTSPLAEELGFPVDQRAQRSWVDPRQGDYDDRMMACPAREPCVPQRDVDGDSFEDGTCGRISDCMRPGQSLLDAAFQNLDLRLGRPPQRANQIGICVPNGPGGGILTGDVCAQAHASGVGTNRSFPSRTVPEVDGMCPDGTGAGASCLTCDDGVGGEGSPSGVPRLCETDFDCNPELDCSGPSGCRISVGSALCNRLTVDFAGVPARQGFCAVPMRRFCPTIIGRELPDWHNPNFSLNPCDAPGPLSVCQSPFAVDPGRDFIPASLECVASGCAACTGAWGPQSYCVSSDECPSSHRCVLDAGEQTISPACILRPILGDGRLQDSLLATTDGNRLRASFPIAVERPEDGTGFTSILTVIPDTIESGINLASDALRRIPGRALVTPRADVCTSRADGTIDFDRGQHVLVTGLEARTTGARVWMEPDTGSGAGAGDVILDVFVNGLVRVAARVEGQFEILGVSHGIDSDLVARVDAQGARVRLRPYVYDSTNGPRLGFRVLAAQLMRTLGPDGSGTIAEASNVTIESSSQQGIVFDVLRVLGVVLLGWTELALETVFENLGSDLGVSRLDFDVAPVGDFFTTLIAQDALGPFLFGEELLPFGATSTLEGAAVELAQDFSRASTGPVPSLGLYMRRAPQRIGGTLSFTETGFLADLVHGGGPGPVFGGDRGGFCPLLDQRSPNCLETAPEGERDTCPD